MRGRKSRNKIHKPFVLVVWLNPLLLARFLLPTVLNGQKCTFEPFERHLRLTVFSCLTFAPIPSICSSFWLSSSSSDLWVCQRGKESRPPFAPTPNECKELAEAEA